MYKNYKVKKRSIPLSIVAATVLLSGVSGLTYLLEIKGVINLYSRPTAQTAYTTTDEAPSFQPTNTVDYTPIRPPDNLPIPEKGATPNPLSLNPELDLTITRATKNTSGDTFLVKVAVVGTQEGSCAATMKHRDIIVETFGKIVQSGGQYACGGLDMPSSKLAAQGTWQLKVTVTDMSGALKEASLDIEL